MLRLLIILLGFIMPRTNSEEWVYFLGFGSLGAFFNKMNGNLLLETGSGSVTVSPSALDASIQLIVAGAVGLFFKLSYDFLKVVMMRRIMRKGASTTSDPATEEEGQDAEEDTNETIGHA